jgi:YVTN family beta-propeller protein
MAEASQIAYVTSELSGVVTGVDVRSLQIVQRMEVANRPHNLEVTADGLIVVATQGTDTVSVIDPTMDQGTVKRISIGAPPHDLAVDADGRTVLVVSERGSLTRLDPVSGRVLQTVKLDGRPHNVIVSRRAAWITDILARRIFVLDGETVHTLPISVVGHDLAAHPASKELWVTPWSSNRTAIIDLETRREIARLQVGRYPSHKHLAFTEDGSEAWITEPESGSLFIVNAQTRRIVERVDLGGHPHHLRFAAGRAYVAVGPRDLVVLDVGTRSVIGRLEVGSEIHDVGLRPPK